ncbi:anthranilate synthase component I [Hydrogenispora ethanolica]|uniref:Anthranilate synthase component 1 n=1 Tax=Hydrogenispora ethanolica TaxID=1082276 RepID=A0A4R1QS54_HYDET|nr:anthranilate synthase component I [Hydrogenispora ethanolica]TCL55843.1 anthranilate synthase component I [Hydrogenispora ethanolica]
MSREAFLDSLPLVGFHGKNSSFCIGDVEIGGGTPVIIAGPCAVETAEQILRVAEHIKNSGAHGLRGGVFKPRSSPYSFQGLGEPGLQLLAEAREKTGLFTVVEVTAIDQIGLVAEYADVLQVGARNMQNFELLKAVGRSEKPVLLKRGLSATIQELLQAAEYILVEGNPRVILCERGIRTFETITRNTLDINAIPLLKQLTHLPVFADPSHGTGRSDLVIPVAKAAIAAGADGLIVEVHPAPDTALSDGNQSLNLNQFERLMEELNPSIHRSPAPIQLDSGMTLTQFQQLADDGYRFIPVYAELLTDSETPVTAFAKLTAGAPVGRFLLESVERGEQLGRFSFIGWDPLLQLTANGRRSEILDSANSHQAMDSDPLQELSAALSELKVAPLDVPYPFYGGAVGYIGYDYVRLLEPIPEHHEAIAEVPDLRWMVPRCMACFDHVLHKIVLIELVEPAAHSTIEAAYQKGMADLSRFGERLKNQLELPPLVNRHPQASEPERNFLLSKAEYEARVEKIKEYIRAGDAFQVVLSQRIEQECHGDPFMFYRVLRTINPSPYLFYLDFGEFQLAGSSPEVMVQSTGAQVLLKPIAGTRPRGATAAQDEQLKKELLNDRKERAEHVMLVDLGRNDLGRVCRFGSVAVTDLMSVENYSHVMHIVSTIRGELLPDMTATDLLRAVFPAGTLSGAPKIRAMQIIEELEPVRRGFYGGAVGYLGFNGNLDTCITIRTVLFKDKKAVLQVGAGIVADSVPEREYEETMNKAGAVLAALARLGG